MPAAKRKTAASTPAKQQVKKATSATTPIAKSTTKTTTTPAKTTTPITPKIKNTQVNVAKPKPVLNHLDQSLVEKASSALLSYLDKQPALETRTNSLDLIDDVKPIYLIVATRKISDSIKLKPVRIPIKNSLITPDSEVLLITKDPQREFKDLFASKNISGVSRIMGVSKLRARTKPYEAKRLLASSYDLFLADDRVITLLPPILGKAFYEKKRHPIPVNLVHSNLQKEIDTARNSTYMHLNRGSCQSIKIGLSTHTPAQLSENIMTAITAIVDKIPRKWSNVQSVFLKSSDSISLPLLGRLPDEGVAEEDVVEEEAEVKKTAKKGDKKVEVKEVKKNVVKTIKEIKEQKEKELAKPKAAGMKRKAAAVEVVEKPAAKKVVKKAKKN